MRTIKFRGFHEDKNGDKEITLNNKKIKGFWVHGDLITDGGCYIGHYAVFPETVGQYVGDVNGKEIFEGDIAEIEQELYETVYEGTIGGGTPAVHTEYVSTLEVQGTVVFENGAYIVKDEDHRDYFLAYCDEYTTIEVIGNIFENPELLEV